MTIALALLILLSLLAVTGVALAVVREVRRDGYGSRPAPASHRSWDDGLTLRHP